MASRPVYLNLFHIYLPLAGWVSIMHRVSGVLLFVAMPLGVGVLSVSLSGEAGFQQVAGWMTHPLAKLFLLMMVWSLVHHFFAGLRHLALDLHWGVELRHARRSAVAVLLATGTVTLMAAWRLFA